MIKGYQNSDTLSLYLKGKEESRMYQKCYVELEMKKTFQADAVPDLKMFRCEVLRYDIARERIYLLLKDGELTDVSLDALYECRIHLKEEKIVSEGGVGERYRDANGKILVFHIENGFYKISINSVDKEEV